MQLNNLSHKLGCKQELNIVDIENGLEYILTNKSYPYKLVINFIKDFSKILDKLPPKPLKIKELFDLIGVPKGANCISVLITIKILTRTLKRFLSQI